MTRVALIGLGEVGRIFAEDLRAVGIRDLTKWDTAFGDPGSDATQAVAAGSTIGMIDAVLHVMIGNCERGTS